ncbi:hypothetical protein [Glaciecola sp. 1036]|uniref:hypothetical protein n=1 Tax=Alteromonadaceae TaxID=72275 RepID=UPI003D05EE14
MNRTHLQKRFISRIKTTSEALVHLDQLGCEVIGLSVNDTGNDIEILPPPDKAHLNGFPTVINHDNKGRHYLMMARVKGCNVSWKVNQFN